MIKINANNSTLIYDAGCISYNGKVLFNQSSKKSFVFLGHGKENISMYHGNFDIHDYISSRLPLTISNIKEVGGARLDFTFSHCGKNYLVLTTELDDQGRLILKPNTFNNYWNRLWLLIKAKPNEKVYGLGEQPSYFNLRGKHFPIWTREQGEGRNKKTLETFYADKNNAGGDYYTTYFPEPTFVSTEKYYCHTTSYNYADFDFSHPDFFELQYWDLPKEIIFETGNTYKELVTKLTSLLGRQLELPDWTNNGAVIGLQGGTERVQKIYARLKNAGVKISGLFCQDWEGSIHTDFGKRNYWEWKYSDKIYPDLPNTIKKWNKDGVKFLSYINPHLINTSKLFKEGDEKGYFVKDQDGKTLIIDFGQFYCGSVDFTNPAAFNWYKKIIKKNLIATGCSGWMADFGEYLPTNAVWYDGSDPKQAHNKYPMLWAKCNYEALKETGNLGKIAYFMRAGAAGSQKYSVLMWAGDQMADWDLDDGLASTIPEMLSTGMTGCGLNHVDIGGYTSNYGIFRTKELFMRYAEMATFSPFMRTHEGNRPDKNFQVYNDKEAMKHFARCTDIFVDLTKYRKAIIKENSDQGIPVQRPLFMEFEKDPKAYDIKYEYMFGPDLLVAPVYQPGKKEWKTYLPETETWIDLWTGKEYQGGSSYTVPAPLGNTPVFYRKNSHYRDLFSSLTKKYALKKAFSPTLSK